MHHHKNLYYLIVFFSILNLHVSLSDQADSISWPTLGTPSTDVNAKAPTWYMGELRRQTRDPDITSLVPKDENEDESLLFFFFVLVLSNIFFLCPNGITPLKLKFNDKVYQMTYHFKNYSRHVNWILVTCLPKIHKQLTL